MIQGWDLFGIDAEDSLRHYSALNLGFSKYRFPLSAHMLVDLHRHAFGVSAPAFCPPALCPSAFRRAAFSAYFILHIWFHFVFLLCGILLKLATFLGIVSVLAYTDIRLLAA
jgi:hypothetical protein